MTTTIADNIYCILNTKNYKQSAIAKEVGYDARKFNDMLKGRKLIKPEDILPICYALGVTPNDLFGYENPAQT